MKGKGQEEMMQPEIRREKVKKYGSFLFCPQRQRLCFGCNTSDGTCRHGACLLDDPEYMRKQAEIGRRVQENARREQEERERERLDPPAPVRRQARTRAQLMEGEIERKEAYAERLYMIGRPRAADSVMGEAMAMRRQLRKMEGAGRC